MNIMIDFLIIIIASIIGSFIGGLIVKFMFNTVKSRRVDENFNSSGNPPSNSRHVVVSNDGMNIVIGYFERNDNQGRGGWRNQGGDVINNPLYWIDIVKFKLKYTINDN